MKSEISNFPEELTPQEIVAELEKYIIGQTKAKRAVAISLRNRYRRRKMQDSIKDEIRPKNILMIGPTGVGKTEIAKRLSQIARVPFLKIEATKFTEVGYVGRDVDSMVRDLMEVSINMLKMKKMSEVAPKAKERAHQRLLDILLPDHRIIREKFSVSQNHDIDSINDPEAEKTHELKRHPLSGFETNSTNDGDLPITSEETNSMSATREKISEKLASGKFDERMVEIEVTESVTPMVEVISQSGVEEMGFNIQGFQNMLGNMFPSKRKRRKVKVAEAREIFIQDEMNQLIDHEEIQREALILAQESGIIFLDEIDKIASSFTSTSGPDVSREGVQRDLLPLVEGTTVITKYGLVRTDHILFFAAGAFNVSKPSDLIPELQGRFPVRVEFDKLSEEDFQRILVEPQNALTKQYSAMLKADGVDLHFTPESLKRIAHFAHLANTNQENIGARRLHTIMERLLDEVSFEAPQNIKGTYEITAEMVNKVLEPLIEDRNLAKFIL